MRCRRTRRLRLAVPEGCGKAEAAGADMKVRGVDVSRSGSAGVAAICLRHAGAFFLVLLVRAKECLAPFWGGVRSVIDDALFTSLKLCE